MSAVETNVIKAKCMNCGLHFAAYSWEESWKPRFCPECGSKRPFMIWQEQSPEFIFWHVPGQAELVGMG
jgi:DNA-directed RNA polymerase subunit RPC12/RpoP